MVAGDYLAAKDYFEQALDTALSQFLTKILQLPVFGFEF